MIQNVIERVIPPRTTGGNVVQSGATGAAAANLALWTGLAAADRPGGKVYVTFEALTQTCYVRFKPTNAAAATTTSNGVVIPVGTAKTFYLDPSVDVYVDVIAAGVGVLKWQVISPPQEMSKAHGT